MMVSKVVRVIAACLIGAVALSAQRQEILDLTSFLAQVKEAEYREDPLENLMQKFYLPGRGEQPYPWPVEMRMVSAARGNSGVAPTIRVSLNVKNVGKQDLEFPVSTDPKSPSVGLPNKGRKYIIFGANFYSIETGTSIVGEDNQIHAYGPRSSGSRSVPTSLVALKPGDTILVDYDVSLVAALPAKTAVIGIRAVMQESLLSDDMNAVSAKSELMKSQQIQVDVSP